MKESELVSIKIEWNSSDGWVASYRDLDCLRNMAYERLIPRHVINNSLEMVAAMVLNFVQALEKD